LENAFDVIVVGLGAMGSAAAYHLSTRRAKVLGLEALIPAHDRGSSHGETRIIRQAYFEHPAYVPLVLRAYEMWGRLQQDSGEELLRITGGLSIGQAGGRLVTGCLTSAAEHGLNHELLDSTEMRRRYPQFVLAENEVAFYEATVGYLRPEECIRQHLRLAAEHGADLRFEEPVLSWTASASGDGVSVTTARRTYRAGSLVICAGPWFAEVVPNISIPVKVSRRAVFWLRPTHDPSAFDRRVFPIFLWEPSQGPIFYGLPRISEAGCPKVAIHSEGEECTPSTIDRVIHARDEQAVRAAIESRIPTLNGDIFRATTCMYTMTPDEHFIIDTHPDYPQVSLAAGFSGHGFKFSPVVGEILAELATARKTASEIGLFSASRFGRQLSA
jgi:sarcosine oxidase